MKKVISIILFSTLIFIFASCGNKPVDSLQKIKGQELINESTSPDNKYIVRAYRNTGGATVDWACSLYPY